MDMNLARTADRLIRIAAVALTLAACSDMSQTQQRTLSGTAGGAAGGALVGAIAGNAGMGAAIGAGVGLAGGMLYEVGMHFTHVAPRGSGQLILDRRAQRWNGRSPARRPRPVGRGGRTGARDSWSGVG
jgi:hypothetical protein